MNIENMTFDELRVLNKLVVARMKVLQQIKTQSDMIKFNLGDRVQFYTHEGELVVGTLIKYNRKTVSVAADGGVQWNVTPSLLSNNIVNQQHAVIGRCACQG
ncbi:MAG: hypothetical protein PHO37_02810 [Kiritimatiellae bacterium]|nr:hypothetical protein [Kiritimatiellia bacterium]